MELDITRDKNKKPRLLIVEGNIGAGKSTFLKIIQENLACKIVFEPHEKWQDIAGKGNLLENFYNNTPRWAYTFQSYAFITRTLAQKQSAKKYPSTTQVLERSVFSDKYCFAKNLYESGAMSDIEWTLYKEWFDWFFEDHIQKPNGFIYLRTTPQTCYNRLKKRNRSEEKEVPLAYLQQLHDKHENWLIKKQNLDHYVQDVPVLILECDKEFETDEAQKNKLITKITDFFDINLYQPAQQFNKNSQLNL
ncbi:deoxynucleoside kinase [Candidatus Dependentiae bacterium]